MSFLLVAPEILESAAADITQIGSTVGAGNLAAAPADEVSAAIAAVFGAHAKEYQAAALPATYHEQFVRGLSSAAASYVSTEASIDTTLQGVVTAVNMAASSELAIEVGTLMSVNNPEPLLMLTHPLPNTGVVVVDGSPQGGWTMESWDGTPVPQASLGTSLFVDVRNPTTAPQFASYDILQAFLTANPATIVNAIRDGVLQVGTATIEFSFAVAQSLIDAVTGS